jgi:uracil-DNA glycosylase family 4
VSDLAEHLRFFGELGVTGISRDRAWRVRPSDVAHNADEDVRRAEPLGSASPGLAIGRDSAAEAKASGRRTSVNRSETLDDICTEIGPDCRRCKLHALGRRQVVFGVGNPKADLMFVGEAPGEDEDLKGEPFVGRAGQLLTKIIEAIDLKREDVYIANVIKCRPPDNRNPEPDEVASCEPFLFRQIDAIKPKVIVPLGRFAAQSLLKTTESITRLRGRVYRYRGAQMVPTYHPAFLLRYPSAKREVWEDMKKVRAILQGEST